MYPVIKWRSQYCMSFYLWLHVIIIILNMFNGLFCCVQAESSLSLPLARSLSLLAAWLTDNNWRGSACSPGRQTLPPAWRRLLTSVHLSEEKTDSAGHELFPRLRDQQRERDLSDCTVVPADELEEGHCNWYLHFGSINNTSSTSSWPCCDFEEQANNRQSNSNDWEEGRLKIRFD